MKYVVLFFVLITISCDVYSQEIRYIRDILFIPLRSGQTTQHRIIHKGLVSGTKLTVIAKNDDGTYSNVRTESGKEGWLQTQYLSDEPSGRYLYEQSLQSIAGLQESNDLLTQQLKTISSEKKSALASLNELTETSSKVDTELQEIKSISANALRLNSDNQRLLEDNQKLKNNLDVLSSDNKRLQDDDSNDAFLNGAFAVLIGVMITLIIPRLWPSKNTDWA
ncbi:MAG: SH3 domain protein [Gammaproteobacteria bacterium]